MLISRAFTRREKVLLVILVLLLLGAFYYLGVQVPVTEAIEQAESEMQLVQTEIDVLAAKNAKEEAMKAELEEIKASGNAAEVAKFDNLSVVITFLDSILSSTNEYTISFPTLTTSEGVVRRIAQLNFEAQSYADACAAVEKLQNCSFCCRVGDVAVTPVENKAVIGGPVDVSVSMTFYEIMNE